MQLATAMRRRSTSVMTSSVVTSSARSVLVIVVLALIAGALAFALGSGSWQSRATVTIVPPQTGPNSPLAQNPLLRLDDNLPQLVTVLAATLRTPDASAGLRRQGAGGSFTIATGTDQSTSAAIDRTPVLQFTATAGSPGSARRTAAALVSVARDQLYRLQTQTDVPGAARATIELLAAPSPAVGDDDARWTAASRTALAVVVVLGGVRFVSVGGRRRQRGTPRPVSGDSATPA